jgi:outer membrane protein TolC
MLKTISKIQRRKWLSSVLIGLTLSSGCQGPVQRFAAWRDSKDIAYFQNFAHQIEYPDVTSAATSETDIPVPLAIDNPSQLPAWDLTLQEAVHQALRSSDVLRSIGGTIVDAPNATTTVLEPSLTESNPFNGVEAALSAFDAQVSTQLFWEKNNQPQNSIFFFLPASLEQTTGNYRNSVTKTAATGTRFSFSSNVLYDRNNRPGNLFDSSFVGFVQAEMRQPLMQGSGTTFNRIAGPNGQLGPNATFNPNVGQYNGVLIARINMDVSLADFERSVIRLINDVETAYWELYFAYRSLDAQVVGRESSLKTWQRIHELQKVGAKGGEADAEAQARSQYYLFESQVNDALGGPRGLYAAEQQLRYLMGIAATDGRLIRPSDQPLQAEVLFDWYQALGDATQQRVEVRRQKWQIKRRELELLASRLNRRARLDAVTQYRWRGLGDHLIDSRDPDDQFASLFQNVTEGNFQEWQAGLEWSYNVGLRQASAAMRNAQLGLVRETNILKEIELKISHDLSNAQRQIARSYAQVQTFYNRVEADQQQVDVLRNRYERGLININILLLAQQSLATSTSSYHRALADYMIAIRDFHREKGSLLNYNQVQLTEAGYSGKAYQDAYEKGRNYTPRDPGTSVEVKPGTVTQGPFDPTSVGAYPTGH